MRSTHSPVWTDVALLCTSLALAACTPTPVGTVREPPPSHAPTPMAAPQPSASLTATAAPTPTLWAGPLPAGAIALYTAGAERGGDLYALTAGGQPIDLGRAVAGAGPVSPSGRWLASLDQQTRPQAVIISDLESGRRHTVPLTIGRGTGYVAWGAFDREEAHLAYVEVGAISPTPVPGTPDWFLVVVDLQDGSARRFEVATASDGSRMPAGRPLGWSPGGEMALDAFRPYSGSDHIGLWGLDLPPDAAAAPSSPEARRPLALMAWSLGGGHSPEGQHLVDWYRDARLSPDGTRLLFLARDLAYRPADYKTDGYDLALNQLWTLDLASGEASCLVDVRDGGGVGSYADWSPDGREILFAQGRYAGAVLWPATLKVWEQGGTLREIGPVPQVSYWSSGDWCRPGTAVLAAHIVEEAEDAPTLVGTALYTVDLATGRTTQVAEAPFIQVLGCVR